MKENDVLIKNRSQSKYATLGFINGLISLNSPLKKSYVNTKFCCHTIAINDSKVNVQYCKNRYCLVCSRISSAIVINNLTGFFELEKDDIYLVTLTDKNVEKNYLRQKIRLFNSFFAKFQNTEKKKGNKHLIFRKLEVTYNIENDSYHPHFHCLVKSEKSAKILLEAWLKSFKSSNILAQDIRKGYNLKEVAKYATKFISKDKIVPFENLDIIFQSLRNVRIYNLSGFTKQDKIKYNIKKKDELDFESNIHKISEYKSGNWVYQFCDWVNDDGEVFSNYVPTEKMQKFIEKFNN